MAIATGLGLALFAVGAAFAWENRIEGQPQFQAGAPAGVYFWHEGTDGGLHLRTTDPEGVEHWYTGQIFTDGKIQDLDDTLLEPWQGDKASVDPGGHSLTFVFHTFSGIDGINYYIDGGTYETVDLQRDGRELPTSHIYLGQYGVNPQNDPFEDNR